ncbi:MAG: hypothetical protein IJ257_08605 [Treponema sp.]|nr:hypothetical protein [Treponema sp.]
MLSISKGQNKKVSLWLALLLLAGLCLSVFSVHADFDHDCAGEDCPVCAVIHIARTNFQNLNPAPQISLKNNTFFFVVVTLFAVNAIRVSKTPVSEKTRLNN